MCPCPRLRYFQFTKLRPSNKNSIYCAESIYVLFLKRYLMYVYIRRSDHAVESVDQTVEIMAYNVCSRPLFISNNRIPCTIYRTLNFTFAIRFSQILYIICRYFSLSLFDYIDRYNTFVSLIPIEKLVEIFMQRFLAHLQWMYAYAHGEYVESKIVKLNFFLKNRHKNNTRKKFQ